MQPAPATATLDTIGLRCPLPILKARRALQGLAPGAVLEVLASDPGAEDDFAAFCRTAGHRLVRASAAEGVHRFLITKAENGAARADLDMDGTLHS